MAKTDWTMIDEVKPSDMNSIGEELNELRDDIDNIQPASLTVAGITKLNNATASTSQTDAATPKAVNDARVAAISAAATDATTKANTAETNAKSYVDSKTWQKHKLTQDNGLSVSINNGNANNLILNGNYVGVNISNAPTTGNSTTDIWYIRVSALSSVWIKQEAFNLVNDTYQTRTGRDNGNLQVVWQPWTPDVFQSGVDAKQGVVNAINAKGGSASMNDTWAQLATKVNAISTGKKFAQGRATISQANGFSVTGLGFSPSTVMYSFFSASDPLYAVIGSAPVSINMRREQSAYSSSGITTNTNGFNATFTSSYSNSLVDWIAYE